MHPIRPYLVTLPAATLFLAGCTLQQTTATSITTPLSQKVSGKIHGGQQPVSGSTVTVYAVGSGGYGSAATALATATSDATGAFQMPAYTCPQDNAPVYIVAAGGNPGLADGTNNTALALGAALGLCSNAQAMTVDINEVTTVALAYSLAQFSSGASDSSFGAPTTTNGFTVQYPAGLTNALLYTAPTLVNVTTGLVNPNTPTTTIAADKIYTIADILAACVNTDGTLDQLDAIRSGSSSRLRPQNFIGSPCGTLFVYTSAPNTGVRPTNTLQAAVNMALLPYRNAAALYNLVSPTSPFVADATPPADLTVTVAYTAPSGASSIADPSVFSNVAIDRTGNLWMPNGSYGVLEFQPSIAAFNGPFNFPTSNFAGSVTQVAVDMNDRVWVAPQTRGFLGYTSTTSPAPLAIQSGTVIIDNNDVLTQPRTVAVGPHGELRYGFQSDDLSFYGVASVLNGSTTYLSPLTAAPLSQDQNLFDAGFLTQPDPTSVQTEFVSSGNVQRTINTGSSTRGGQITMAANGDTLYPLFDTSQICHYDNTCAAAGFAGLNQPLGLATDGLGTEWAVNSGNNSLSNFNVGTTGGDDSAISHYILGSTLMPAPSAVAIDQSGNIWITNPYAVPYVLTEVVGSAGPTIQPIAAQNQNLTGFLTGTRPGEVPNACIGGGIPGSAKPVQGQVRKTVPYC